MKFVLVLLAVSAAGTLADQSESRTKKDIPSVRTPPAAKPNTVCIYADVSKTGKKTVVCGDAAPPILAALQADNAVATISAKDRQPEAKAASAKCLTDLKSKPVKLYVQEPEHHQEQINYVVPQVQQYVQPHVQYVQPQVQYVQPQVPCPQPQIHYEQPQVHVVQPQVHLIEPQVHVLRPQVHYERPQVHYEPAQVQYVQPTKSLCPTFEPNNGWYSRSVPDGYPTMVRTVDQDLLVDGVPATRTVDIAAIPFDRTGSARETIDYDTMMDAKRFSPAMFRSVVVKDAPELRYGYNSGVQDVQTLQQQDMRMQQQQDMRMQQQQDMRMQQQQDMRTQQQQDMRMQQQQDMRTQQLYAMPSFGGVRSQQPSFDAMTQRTVQERMMDDGMQRRRQYYGYPVGSDPVMSFRAADEQTANRLMPVDGAVALDDDNELAATYTRSTVEDPKNVKQQPFGEPAAVQSNSDVVKSTTELKKVG